MILSRYAQEQVEHYRSRLPRRASLQSRLELLVSIRNEEGYLAEARKQKDGSFLLIENHCPIARAAQACPTLCQAELEVFRSVLGPEVVIARREHTVAGARRCVYQITGTK